MQAKILIIDSSKKESILIKNILCDHNVLTAHNSSEAMKEIEKNEDIDFILIDLDMPQKEGFRILEAIKSNDKYCDLRIITLSSFGELDSEIMGLRLGAIDSVTKPIDQKLLRMTIDMHLKFKSINSLTELSKEIMDLFSGRKAAELIAINDSMKKSELLFRGIFNQAPIGIAIVRENDVLTVNPMYEKILGRTQEELSKINWQNITHPEDLEEDVKYFEKFKDREIDSYDMEKRYLRPDGSYVWVHMFIKRISWSNISDNSHLCLLQDISSRKYIEKVLNESERSKSVLLANLPGMAYRCSYDRNWTMHFVSEGCYVLTGYKAEDLLNNTKLSFNDIIVPEYRDTLWAEWEQTLSLREQFKYEYEIIAADGVRKWVLEMGQGVYDENGNIEALEGIIIDISELKERESQIQYLYEHDYLTDLHNRQFLEKVLEKDLYYRYEGKRAILLVNLHNFNNINITYGYNFGEKIIRELSEILINLCDKNCQLYQISLDRFAFYIKDYQQSKELADFCEVIIEKLNTLSINTIKGSIGILEINNCEAEPSSILKNASIASESTFDHETFSYRFFDYKMEEKIMREARITDALTQSVISGEGLYMKFQPIFDIKAERIHGFEALARLKTTELGEISPMEFIPIAEKTQLIVPLGIRIMKLVFRFLKEIEEKGYDSIIMSFNISAIQLFREDFLLKLKEVIDETKVDPYNLCIEITESIFVDNLKEINKKLEKLKELGIKIAIDDFGTGYSSLARQRELNIDCLKLDKYFIDKLKTLNWEEAITSDIISMAHKLGHFVVAEGVEDVKQMQYLIENNCDCIQGYLFSEPLDEDAAVEMLIRTNN